MAYDLTTRLVAYNIDGTKRGEIVAPLEMTYYDKAGDTPTLTASWSHYAATHERLAAPCMVGFEIRHVDHAKNIVYWVEHKNSRFIITDQTYDRKDRTGKYTFNAIGNFGMLPGAIVGLGKNLNSDNKRSFTNTTTGNIVSTLFNEAKSRGCFPWMTIDFNASVDSYGNAWLLNYDRDYEASNDLRTVIQDLYTNGFLNYWFEGNVLRVIQQQGATDPNVDHTKDANPVWIRDSQVPSSPEEENYSTLANSVMLMGDNNTYMVQTKTDGYAPFGTREMVLDAGGITITDKQDTVDAKVRATALNIANSQLEQTADITRTYTREWTFVDDIFTPFVPLRDFFVDEWIYIDTVAGHKQKMQVVDYHIELKSDNSLSLAVTAGSVRDDMLTTLARTQKALTDGAKLIGTGRARQTASPASTFESDPGVASTGVKLTKTGFDSFDTNKDKTFNIDAKTGSVAIGDPTSQVNMSGSDGSVTIGDNSTDENYKLMVASQKRSSDLAGDVLLMKHTQLATADTAAVKQNTMARLSAKTGSIAMGGAKGAGFDDADGLRVNGSTGKVSLTGDYYSSSYSDKKNCWVQINDSTLRSLYSANGYTFTGVDTPGTDTGTSVGGIVFNGDTAGVSKSPPMIYTKSSKDGNGTLYGGLALSLQGGSTTVGTKFTGVTMDMTDSCTTFRYIKTAGATETRVAIGQNELTTGINIQLGFSQRKNAFAIGGLPETTSSGRALQNMYWVNGWNQDYIALLSSSSKNKLDQQPVELDAVKAMLQVKPITWLDRMITEENPDNDKREVGFTAENVASISEANDGILETVVFREDGVPSGLAYDRMPDAYTMRALQDIYERLEKLEGSDK